MRTIKPAEIDEVQFWNEWVSQRKPVILDGHLMDADWKASAKWDDAYFSRHAGHARVVVEHRDGPKGTFGQGKKIAMAFKDFVQRMHEGDDTLYLTTQQVGVSKKDGHPELWAAPLIHLTHDFPPCPSIMGGLVPQQINLWMGCTKDGASSGLHHDFHDNLYVLMRGQKRFRLWPPEHAPCMHTAGKVAHVHPNGRIVYEGQGDISADGSSASEVALWKACRSAEAAVQAAEQGVAAKRKGAARALEKAEARLDAALDAQLTHKLEGQAQVGGGVEDEDDDDDEVSLDMLEGLQDDYLDEDAAGSSQEGEGLEEGNKTRQRHKEEEGDPPSFCTGVDLSLPDEELKAAFPGFPGKAAALEVTLNAGQMLYLPAGWFHEVTSFSLAPTSDPTTSKKKSSKQGSSPDAPACSHMALNYWFHPPDNLEARGRVGVAKPYKSDFWPALWRSRATALGISIPEPNEHIDKDVAEDEEQMKEEEEEEEEEGIKGEATVALQPASKRRKGKPKKLQPLLPKQANEEGTTTTQQPQLQHEQHQGSSKRKGQPKKLQPVSKPGQEQQQLQQGDGEQEGGSMVEAGVEGPLLPGEDGELGDMVAEEMHSYFQSPEGSGAFKSALGTYMLKAMLKEQLKGMQQRNQQQRCCLRSKGRRHHKCVRSLPEHDD